LAAVVTDTPQSEGSALINCLRAILESSQISRGIMGIAFNLTAKEFQAGPGLSMQLVVMDTGAVGSG
jgi:hypothetical protein